MRYFYFLSLLFLCNGLSSQTINVSTNTQLQNALANAVPGQTILIADGIYNASSGNFGPPIGVNGTSSQPITVKGSRNAILTTGDSAHGYGFWLQGNKYWILKGFTTRTCKNGVMVDSSQYITVDSVQAVRIGQSGIDLRTYSSYCTVKNCYVDSTGLIDDGVGEGIYVGSAYENWSVNTAGNPDTCNYNQILYNSFGNKIKSENVDIKEGTKYGLVRGNIFNGKGLTGVNGGDSWVDVKGNYWTIELNTGTNSYLDGFQTHIQQTGWGNYNTFNKNTLNVNASGYGIRITTSNSNGTALNNIVCNNNLVTSASSGLTNISTTTCTPPIVLANELLNWNVTQQNNVYTFSWIIAAINNLHHFIIEESNDGINFSSLQSVKVSGLNYSIFLNLTSVSGNYFRLILFNNNGSKTYSSIIHISNNQSEYKIYNQNNSITIFNPNNNAIVKIFDAKGSLIQSSIISNGYNYIYLPNVQKGLYIITIIDNQLKKITSHQLII
jgi:hypothetical protein